jgi:methionyl aminopeptidase
MIFIKNKREIELMRTAGQRLARIMQQVDCILKPGVSTWEIDQFLEKLLIQNGLKGECKGFAGYPCVSCISINDVVVHGIPRKEIILKTGDFVKIDLVGSFKGYCADMARGFFVGPCSQIVVKLDQVAKAAFFEAFELIKPGIKLSDISSAIEKYVKVNGFFVVKEFAGHGIGRKLHEDPEIPNYGQSGCGPVLREGMTLAIEPMITENFCAVNIDLDGWTARTTNGCLAAHFENTVVVTKLGAEILTE